jgi:hypothetical protein
MTIRLIGTHSHTNTRSRRLEDRVQLVANVLALVPGVNIPASIVSGVISYRKRDYAGVSLCLLAIIPIEGEGAALIKLARDAGHARSIMRSGTRTFTVLRKFTAITSSRRSAAHAPDQLGFRQPGGSNMACAAGCKSGCKAA